jgi:hypothetical protein
MTLTLETTATLRVRREALRRLGGPNRLVAACRMSDDSREVTLAGIRHRHPDWADAAVHGELLRTMLGSTLGPVVLGHVRSTT